MMGEAMGAKKQRRPAPEPEWLTALETGRVLRLSRRPLYRALRTGAIPAVKLGNVYRVRRADLENLAAGHRATEA